MQAAGADFAAPFEFFIEDDKVPDIFGDLKAVAPREYFQRGGEVRFVGAGEGDFQRIPLVAGASDFGGDHF